MPERPAILADSPLFLVTGPSAAGKSTVGRLLAKRFPRGVHLEADVFRRCIVSGRAEMTPDPSAEALDQLLLRYRLAAAAADLYAANGFTVVVEDVIGGEMLATAIALIRARPMYTVVLLPSLEVVAAREAARSTDGYEHWTLGALYKSFASHTPRIGLWLDTSEHTPEQTVEAILARTMTGDARSPILHRDLQSKNAPLAAPLITSASSLRLDGR